MAVRSEMRSEMNLNPPVRSENENRNEKRKNLKPFSNIRVSRGPFLAPIIRFEEAQNLSADRPLGNGPAGQPVEFPLRKPNFISPKIAISFLCVRLHTGRTLSNLLQV